ncbi:MAG: hypothetical protein JKX97_05900, partial [Candidatus Lindowbacteria bacterium]|nr:hypothetical protein [Candidatus Lindowbacteria bacterium]
MKSKYFIFTLLFLFFLVIETPAHAKREFMTGVNYAHIHRGNSGYGSTKSLDQKRRLINANVNWIAITPFAYQKTVLSPDIAFNNDRSMTDANVIKEIEDAHELGMKVAIKPHVWSSDFWSGDEWHGTIRQTSSQDHKKWWKGYRNYVLHFAHLAADYDVELYIIGTELVEMTRLYPDEWRALIRDIRKFYKGQLSYAAHWNNEPHQIKFWDDLDFIGVGVYFPMNLPDGATTKELIQAWTPYRNAMSDFSKKHGKDIAFLEVGYRRADGVWRSPWEY